MKYQAVIFDFGGVLTTSPVENFAVFERERGLSERFIGEVIKTNLHDNAWAKFERAEITFEEFDAAFAEESKAAGFEISGRTLAGLLAVRLRPEMVEALRRIKAAGYKTGCITNTLPEHERAAADPAYAEEARRVLALFDHVIESSKTGVRKPEPRIYEMMCAALDVAPEACIFIDDLGINLKPARAMGMTTVKAPFGDVAPAIDALGELLALRLRG